MLAVKIYVDYAEKDINNYLTRGYTVFSITPILIDGYQASKTVSFLVIFNKNGES